jgi:hypothetical protein
MGGEASVNGLDNTLYYTFSTISQTLAGALGLLAAFIIIRIGAFNLLLHDHARDLYESVGGDAIARQHYVRGDKPALFKWFRDRHEEVRKQDGTGNPPQPFLDAHHELVLTEAEAMLGRKAAVTKDTTRALFVSAIEIFACFAALAIAHWLKTIPCLAYILLVLILAGAASCLGLYVQLLRRALREA